MKKRIFHFSKKITIWLYRFFEAFLAFVLVIGSLAFWKLYTDPMDAKFLLPTVSDALLPKDMGYSLDVQSAILSAGFEESGLFHLEMKNLQLIRPDKTVAMNFPKVNLSYGLLHILTLNYMPDRLLVVHPDIQMVIDQDGAFSFSNASKTEDEASSNHMIQLPTMKKILRHALSFNRIIVTDGKLSVKDKVRQQNFVVPKFDVRLSRRYGFRHVGRVTAVIHSGKHLIDIKAKATYNRLIKNLNLEMSVNPVYPVEFGKYIPILKGVDFPVSVVIGADFSGRKRNRNIAESMEKLQFQIKTVKGGKLSLPSPILNSYVIQSAEINGAATDGFKNIKIGQSFAVLGGGISADLNIDVKGAETFIKTGDLNALNTVLKAIVKDVPIADVPKVWPEEQGTSAHTWVKTHLSKGRVSNAEFVLTFKGGELVDVFGDIYADGVRVDYLPKMPALDDVSAEVLLYPNQVKIVANKGTAGHVHLNHADIFFDLDKTPEQASLLLELSGPVSEMLKAINQKPLALLKDVPLNFDKISGKADTKVKLDFPLDENTIANEILVDVTAAGDGLGIVLDGVPAQIKNGTGLLHVTNEELDVEGTIFVEDQKLTVHWKEDFTPPKGTNSSYEISGNIDVLGLKNLVKDIDSYGKGIVPINVKITRAAPARHWKGKALLNLEKAEFILHPLAVKKETNQKGTLELVLDNAHPDFSEGEGHFHLDANENGKNKLVVKGQLGWGSKYWIEFDNVSSSVSDFSGKIESSSNALSVVLKGNKWNLSQLMNMPWLQPSKKINQEEKEAIDYAKSDFVLPENIKLDVTFKEFLLHPQKPMSDFVFQGVRRNKMWEQFYVNSVLETPFVLTYNPATRSLHGNTKDLGQLLSYLNLSERFAGGEILLDSKQDDKGFITGKISVKEFELKETGFLLQAVSILGIIDGLRGKNLIFSESQIPFEITPDGIINLTDGYTAGTNIGITFSGIINFNKMKLEGSVIPAYAVNSLPGKIPLIGALFRAGEGGGLLGVRYSITGKTIDPVVEAHPLSSMAPGVLGKIF